MCVAEEQLDALCDVHLIRSTSMLYCGFVDETIQGSLDGAARWEIA
jgi:hypothetical protein